MRVCSAEGGRSGTIFFVCATGPLASMHANLQRLCLQLSYVESESFSVNSNGKVYSFFAVVATTGWILARDALVLLQHHYLTGFCEV